MRRLLRPADARLSRAPRPRLRLSMSRRWLAQRGFRVLRFWNNDVLTHIEDVMATINRVRSVAMLVMHFGHRDPEMHSHDATSYYAAIRPASAASHPYAVRHRSHNDGMVAPFLERHQGAKVEIRHY